MYVSKAMSLPFEWVSSKVRLTTKTHSRINTLAYLCSMSLTHTKLRNYFTFHHETSNIKNLAKNVLKIMTNDKIMFEKTAAKINLEKQHFFQEIKNEKITIM
jgi:hypothetical protein